MKIYLESLKNMINKGITRSKMCVNVGQCFNDGDNNMFVEVQQGTP